MKIAIVFPGQGSQYVGMGRELYESRKEFKEVFDKASEILKFDLKKICFEGPEELQKQTEITQPLVFTHSAACFNVLKEAYDINQIFCAAGHSLGEYAALYSSGIFELKEALIIVEKRGEIIQHSNDVQEDEKGVLVSIVGLERKTVKDLCKDNKDAYITLYNCPGQYVIGGKRKYLRETIEKAKEKGAKMITELKVTGAFHTPLYKEVSDKFSAFLSNFNFENKFRFPVIANATAQEYTNGDIQKNLVEQLYKPVRWEDSITYLISRGVDTFIELGPGTIVNGMIKRINPKVKRLNIEDNKSLDKTLQELRC